MLKKTFTVSVPLPILLIGNFRANSCKGDRTTCFSPAAGLVNIAQHGDYTQGFSPAAGILIETNMLVQIMTIAGVSVPLPGFC